MRQFRHGQNGTFEEGRSQKAQMILTGWLVAHGRQDAVEELVSVEVALEAAEAVRGAVEKHGQVVRVLDRGLQLVDFEPEADREALRRQTG